MNASTADEFWVALNRRAVELESAIRNEDAELLTITVDELAEMLWQYDDRLNLNIHGPDPFRIGILALPGAESVADEFVQSNRTPANWVAGVGLPDDALELIRVQDETGDVLKIAYEDLYAIVLPPKDGQVNVLLALDEEFDPRGDRAHLYQAVADEVVNTLLGGEPPELARSVLVPLSTIDADLLQPVLTLREQWISVVLTDGNDA